MIFVFPKLILAFHLALGGGQLSTARVWARNPMPGQEQSQEQSPAQEMNQSQARNMEQVQARELGEVPNQSPNQANSQQPRFRSIRISKLVLGLNNFSDLDFLKQTVELSKKTLQEGQFKSPETKKWLAANSLRAANYLHIKTQLSKCAKDLDLRIDEKLLAGASSVSGCDFLTEFREVYDTALKTQTILDKLSNPQIPSNDKTKNLIKASYKQAALDTYSVKWALNYTFKGISGVNCNSVSDGINEFKEIEIDLRKSCLEHRKTYIQDEKLPDKDRQYLSYAKEADPFKSAAQDFNAEVEHINTEVRKIKQKMLKHAPAWKGKDISARNKQADFEFDDYYRAQEKLASTPLGAITYSPTIIEQFGRIQTPHNVTFNGKQYDLYEHGAIDKVSLIRGHNQTHDILDKRLEDLKEIPHKLKSIKNFGSGFLSKTTTDSYDEQEKKKLDDVLKYLLKQHAPSLGKVLMRNPELANGLCSTLQEISSQKQLAENSLDFIEYGSLIAGLVPVVGWGARVTGIAARSALMRSATMAAAGDKALLLASGAGPVVFSTSLTRTQHRQEDEKTERELQLYVRNNPELKKFDRNIKEKWERYKRNLYYTMFTGSFLKYDIGLMKTSLNKIKDAKKFLDELNRQTKILEQLGSPTQTLNLPLQKPGIPKEWFRLPEDAREAILKTTNLEPGDSDDIVFVQEE